MIYQCQSIGYHYVSAEWHVMRLDTYRIVECDGGILRWSLYAIGVPCGDHQMCMCGRQHGVALLIGVAPWCLVRPDHMEDLTGIGWPPAEDYIRENLTLEEW